MSYFIIIRGPAGVGKSVIAKKLAKSLKGYYISFDEVIEKNKLDIIEGNGISAKNFIKANQLVIPEVKKKIKNNKIVVFDGCFYRKKQIEHLKKNILYKHYIFSLKAPLSECLLRNKSGKRIMTEKAITEVYDLVSKIKMGIPIDTSGKSVSEIVEEIMKHLPK